MCELRYDVREGLVNEGYSYSGRRVAYHLLGLTRCLRAPRSPTKYRQSVPLLRSIGYSDILGTRIVAFCNTPIFYFMNRVVQAHSTDTFHTKTGSPCNILCTSLRSSGINAIPPWEAYSKRRPKYRCMGSRVLCQISAWESVFHSMELVSYAWYFFEIFRILFTAPMTKCPSSM